LDPAEDVMICVKDLSVSYGRIKALRNVHLEVRKGEIVVLLGSNGAGKTSVMKTILGMNSPDSGTVIFEGRNITGMPVDRNVRSGITLVPEGQGVFVTMSVMDNLLLGAHHETRGVQARGVQPKGVQARGVQTKLNYVFEAFPVLGRRKNQLAGTLSGGERQMLAIARALMSTPRMIMVDEPSIGLAPIVINTIFDILINLNKEGYSILLSEQNVYKVLKFAHRGYVLEAGRVVKEGRAGDLLNDPAIQEAYLGVS
jgi:branched-chain amino acid transport system ATP-binding protein